MSFSKFLIASAALIGFVSAQAANGTVATGELGIEAIKANFVQAALTGEKNLLPAFEPVALLTASYGTVGAITPGQPLSIDQVKPAPVLSVTPANSSVQLTGNYTVMMVDADFVGASVDQITRHWLVNYVTVSGTAVSNATANEPTPYAGPFPAENSGKHRYVILMYEQPATFANPAEFVGGVTKINLQEYVKTSGLGNLVAGTYIQVEQGSASFSVAATSAVVTSTLPAAKTTAASGSGSGSKTAGGPSNSVTGSGSPAPTGGASSMTINSVVALGAAAVGAVFML